MENSYRKIEPIDDRKVWSTPSIEVISSDVIENGSNTHAKESVHPLTGTS